jgi:membrane-associated phospholipid phosphatase
MTSFRNPFPRWLWWLPFVGIAVMSPLWLHVWEPAQFVALNTLFLPVPGAMWAGLSLLGNGWGVLAVTAPLLVVSPRLMAAWLCAAPFAALFTRIGKEWIVSPRPAALLDSTQMRTVGELLYTVSMPSGHTTTAFAWTTAIYLALTTAQKKRHGWLLLLAFGVGLSRIAVGAHWPGDVAVGMCLGLLSALMGNTLLETIRAQPWTASDRVVGSAKTIAGVAVAAAIYMLMTQTLDFEETLTLQRVVALWATVSLVVLVIRSLALHFKSPHRWRR